MWFRGSPDGKLYTRAGHALIATNTCVCSVMVIMKLGNELLRPFMEVLDFLGREHDLRVVVEPHVFEEHIKGQPDFPYVYTFDAFSDRDRWVPHARPFAATMPGFLLCQARVPSLNDRWEQPPVVVRPAAHHGTLRPAPQSSLRCRTRPGGSLPGALPPGWPSTLTSWCAWAATGSSCTAPTSSNTACRR